MKHRRTLIAVLLILGSIIMGVIYLWFASIGTWTKLSQTSTYYYRMIADGFLAGSPSLLIEPDPRLAQLVNPYPPENRENIPVLMDAAYYKGRYYFYFGPAPAVILAGIVYLLGRPVSDGYFTFISAWMIFFFSAMIILRIWRNHFSHIPLWLLILSLLLTGLIYPVLFSVNSARIYEAAGLAGSAFVMAGLFFAFSILDGKTPKNHPLLLAGGCWGLAIGSRVFSLVIIGVLCTAIFIRLFWQEGMIHFTKNNLRSAFSLLVPIGFTLIALGWYNFIRFDDPLETGLKYSLIGVKGTSAVFYGGQIFNLRFFLPNLVNYLLNPLEINKEFPFVREIQGNSNIYEMLTGSNQGYYREGIAGILIAIPTVIFISVFIWFAIKQIRRSRSSQNSSSQYSELIRPNDLFFSISSIGLASLMGFLALSFYFVITTRYLLDFVNLLNLVIITGIWITYDRVKDNLSQRIVFSSLTIFLASYSIVLSLLLAFTGEIDRFQKFNPELFERLVQLFS